MGHAPGASLVTWATGPGELSGVVRGGASGPVVWPGKLLVSEPRTSGEISVKLCEDGAVCSYISISDAVRLVESSFNLGEF